MIDGFEWDEDKRLACLKERGVDFADAAQIFRGKVIEQIDARENYDERRIRALGSVDDDWFIVAYTWRGEIRRIISAWKVGKDGRRRYQTLLDG